MKLKPNINCTDFLLQARKCHGDVFFCTAAGDRLNLKSILCEYIFVSAAFNSDLLANGRVVCDEESDAALLADFVEGGNE